MKENPKGSWEDWVWIYLPTYLSERDFHILINSTSSFTIRGLHRLEKYLNMQPEDCLEKSLKIKFALKST